MRHDHQDFAEGVKFAAIAAASAVITATLVIGVGQSLLPRADAPPAEVVVLTRASLR